MTMTAEEIKSLRDRLGLTQKELAEAIGVTITTVSRWEMGIARPSKLALYQLKHLSE